MKPMKIAVLCVLLTTLTGCYLEDRARDFADCFRANLSGGLGISAHARVMQVGCGVGAYGGLGMGVESKGIFRDGVPHREAGIPFSWFIPTLGTKEKSKGHNFLLIVPSYMRSNTFRGLCLGIPKGGRDSRYGLFGFPILEYLSHTGEERLEDYFWIEGGAAAVLLGVRIGFNPAEFADFLLGWTTLDIFGDDGRGKEEPEPEEPEKKAEEKE